MEHTFSLGGEIIATETELTTYIGIDFHFRRQMVGIRKAAAVKHIDTAGSGYIPQCHASVHIEVGSVQVQVKFRLHSFREYEIIPRRVSRIEV